MEEPKKIDVKRPPVGFHFSVSIPGSMEDDVKFSEVSGLSAEVTTEEITEGGENGFKHRLPSVKTFPMLTLKRGLVWEGSPLLKWVYDTISNNYSKAIELKDINVSLLNMEKGAAEPVPIKTWLFKSAYPVKYEASGFKADSNQLAIESIEFSYRNMEDKGYPFEKKKDEAQ